MITLGAMNRLIVKSISESRMILEHKEDKTEVYLDLTLPENQREIQGLEVEAFVDKDAADCLQASLLQPQIVMGEIKYLKVVDITNVGVFLDWGLSHDLFLPHKNHRLDVKMGDQVLVMLTINPKGRISATAEIYDELKTYPPYEKGDIVPGIVYSYSEDLQAYFVALEGVYHGMIPVNELIGESISIGDNRSFRIKRIRVDGKADCTPKKKAYQLMDDDAHRILVLLEKEDDFLPLHDKSNPEDIKTMLGMSKASFKRAIGRLYKQGKIEIENDGIRRK